MNQTIKKNATIVKSATIVKNTTIVKDNTRRHKPTAMNPVRMNTVTAPGVMACHCSHGINVDIPGQQLVQQPIPMQHIHQQTGIVACRCGHGVNMQMMQMQPGVVVGSVVAAPVLTTTMATMMVPQYCQSSLAMVQMPMAMVGAPQVVSSMAVPVPGQVLGEVTVVGV
ncbi:hypothetical protein B0T18DRAFT_387129 [Schizothecium vesticola]|uniref:Uncharacterized protein n=1 Tax=Schizothecium vesticola TaxID=314040 RepID=A0AA40F476_9PEZI|nr:hypothetical protein B0T18DRAFT_387129 [Schizothecium vesticola]